MSDHRVELAGGWSLWRWVCVRGAGFPADMVLALAAPEAAAAADALVALEADAEATPEARRAAEQELAARHGEAAARSSQTLRALLAEPRFREAVLWQNRAAIHRGFEHLARRPPGATNAQTRKLERAVAMYLQRYAVKNDTIGFFGPVGWGELAPAGQGIRAVPGPTLLSCRTVYFEHWAIDALAARLAADAELLPDLPPRPAPTIWLDGRALHHPIDRVSELPEEFARVLAACDGETSARAIAAALGGDEVYAILEELAERRLITWTLEVPTAGDRPERHLRRLLSAARPEAGARGLAALDELESARDRVAAAAGDPEALDRALGELEEVFVRLTDRPATRAAGRTYAGRTLVYEDCRRDLALEVGGDLLARLGPPLGLLLTSARWYTHRIAALYRELFDQAHDELARETGSSEVSYLRFARVLPALFPGPGGPPGVVARVAGELWEHWSALLAPEDWSAPIVRRRSSDLAPLRAQLAAPGPGWPSARHHSPDILIAAAGAEMIGRGAYTIVIGEIHTGMNSLTLPVFFHQHPRPELLVAAREADLPDAGVAPTWSSAITRADLVSVSRHDLELETGEARSARPRAQVLAAGALRVVPHPEQGLMVEDRASGRRFDIIVFLEHHLIAESFSRFALLPPRAHTPRLEIDGVIVSRERWLVGGAELPFVRARDATARFAGARRWAAECGFPTRVFVRTDREPKPIYVDLESPIFVEVLCKCLREASEASITEMVPRPEECWLMDADGNRFTSELRLVAVDERAFDGPSRAL